MGWLAKMMKIHQNLQMNHATRYSPGEIGNHFWLDVLTTMKREIMANNETSCACLMKNNVFINQRIPNTSSKFLLTIKESPVFCDKNVFDMWWVSSLK